MSDRINELISNVKQFIQDENRPKEDCIKSIENEIDSKENQIRELFAENIDSVIAHFLKYHQTLFHHRRIETECEQFSKHIEKSQKLNAYDEQQIDKIQKNLQFMKEIKNRMSEYRNQVKLAKTIVLNLKEEKYNKAIKSINEYKEGELKKETPLKGVLPIVEKRIEGYLKKLLDSFWEQNNVKMKDIGKSCFQKMSSNYQEKLNIYQIFFGNNMSRSTIMNRNSMSAFRCTVLNKQNSSRIMKSYDESSADYLNKVMVRVSVEMSALKKVKVMVVQLNNQAVFNEMLRASIKSYLGFIEESHTCEKEEHFVDLLSFLIGYLLIKRQISAFFDISLDNKIFLKQIYQLIGKQIKRVIQISKNVELIVSLKDKLLIFHRILTILDLNENNENYNQIIGEVIKMYNSQNLQIYESLSVNQIANDNLTHFETKDEEKDSLIRQMLDMGTQQFKFTSYVTFVMEYVLKSYNEIASLLQESDISKNYIYEAISDLYDRVLKIYGSEVLGKDQHYQIIQGQVNIIHLNKIYRYIIRQLQIYHGIISTNKLNDKYQQLIVKLTRNILEVIRQKLSKLMEDYSCMSSTAINQSYNQFVEWTLQFIFHIIVFMKEINCPNYQQVSIETMRQMCQLYWDYLKSLKQINLVIIYNLDLDLSFIYRFCSKNFTGNMSILDKFKSLREFYALMLTNNINDFLQPQKKELSYPNLSIELIVPMLKKYSQAKSTNGKIRDLKKKDVENVVKKLLQNSK